MPLSEFADRLFPLIYIVWGIAAAGLIILYLEHDD
tara:strand:- start:357 stop:461 length:105 start_codon:yes stop_codon:yes gene_type:complete